MKEPLDNSKHKPATATEIEAGITVAVQSSDPDCAKFKGVIITPCEIGESGADWIMKGVKYGRAPRDKCDAALETIVKKLQTQFILANRHRRRSV